MDYFYITSIGRLVLATSSKEFLTLAEERSTTATFVVCHCHQPTNWTQHWRNKYTRIRRWHNNSCDRFILQHNKVSQKILNFEQKCYLRHKPSLNPWKTELIMFKGNPHSQVPRSSKLTWKDRKEHKKKKTIATVWACRELSVQLEDWHQKWNIDCTQLLSDPW